MIFKSAMSVDNNQGAVGVHSLERDTWRNRRRAEELNNLKHDMWVKIQENMVDSSVAAFRDRITHMLTLFF
jgi:hypothetical protein